MGGLLAGWVARKLIFVAPSVAGPALRSTFAEEMVELSPPLLSLAMFTFQQFVIDDAHCAMKVGTDGVLLGAWAGVEGARRILDVGCGSGLIALMAAQRNASARVVGVEIAPEAVADARLNVARSPFASRVVVEQGDVVSPAVVARLLAHGPFDCVVSNPPYHEEELLPPSAGRAAARHTDSGLSFEALLHVVARVSGPASEVWQSASQVEGVANSVPQRVGEVFSCDRAEWRAPRFCVVLPTAAVSRFVALAAAYGFCPERRTDVVTRPHKSPKRSLLSFLLRPQEPVVQTVDVLPLLAEDGGRSEAYARLCRHFYL